MSFFVGRDPIELRRHVTRLALVLLVSVVCYAMFPLRFTFERPAVDGVFGPLYGALAAFDLPYNRAPSLHVAVLVVLWARWGPHLNRTQRACLGGWFLLIGVSVLTTYQHHVIDVLAGLTLGAAAVALTSSNSGRRALSAGGPTPDALRQASGMEPTRLRSSDGPHEKNATTTELPGRQPSRLSFHSSDAGARGSNAIRGY
jgi:hypothetical protein